MSKTETFLNWIDLAMIIKYDKDALMQISTGLWHVYHVACQKGRLKSYFLDIDLITFSERVISEIENLWGSSFFFEYSKIFIDFKNSAKNSAKFFCFWDNCIWIGIVKLSLLRRGYFSLPANVLRSSHKMAWQ